MACALAAPAHAAPERPNVLVILADDAGLWSIDAYRGGPMGGSTPNIDRLAREGALLTDYYGQQSVAAGRGALLTGQSPFRLGLLSYGLPGATPGSEVPTIASLLAARGYATAESGRRGAPLPMELAEDALLARSLDFMERSSRARQPFFLWHNPADPAELDRIVGRLLGKLDELRIADRSIVVFSSASGAKAFSWPGGRSAPFRGEKGTTWEGGFRVPCLVRWPGVIEPGTVIGEVMSHEDWLPTLMAAAGDPGAKQRMLALQAHLDGYDFLPFFRGDAHAGPRREVLYFDSNANLHALRYGDCKVSMWVTGLPIVINLRRDPLERLQEPWSVREWGDKAAAEAVVTSFLESLERYRPRQDPGPFGVRQFLEMFRAAAAALPGGPTSDGRRGGLP